jgi:hypothetical protein
VTVTEKWHVDPGLVAAPARLIVLGAVTETVPPHIDSERFATLNPNGRVSLNAIGDIGPVFRAGLVMEKLSVEVAPTATAAGLKTEVNTGGASTSTLTVAGEPMRWSEVGAPVLKE